ncbi:MAG: ATP-binding cassette domain-containing protein, partial [Streptomyces sp.]|uniref:ATP-binding cassette domain-containing protein n=1 Tax=Streptomyces sp. TaxID=1931 RepID=UPI003D6AE723
MSGDSMTAPAGTAYAPGEAILEVSGLVKHFPLTQGVVIKRQVGAVKAVDGVSFDLTRGETLGIVGESDCGKSTVAKLVTHLETPTAGRIRYKGEDITRLSGKALKAVRRNIQIVFQDPYTSLDPHQSLRRVLDEVQQVQFSRPKAEREARTRELLDAVGLAEKEARALPRELSGGQRQRAAIARALATEPKVLILDEAVSALDVSIQAQILNLVADLRREFRLTYILISHDLTVVRQVADEVLVMYRGRVVEQGPVATILKAPQHPYTQRLLESVPRPGMSLVRRKAKLELDETGCLFRGRCPK